MTIKQTASMALALAVSATAANAADISWNLNADGNWGDAENWSPNTVPGAADDVILDKNVISTTRTLSLNGHQTVNSLSAINHGTSNHVFAINSGTPNDSTLTILSGNITADAGPSSGSGEWTPLRLGSSGGTVKSSIVIGDGVTPVTDAEWVLQTTGSSGNSRGRVKLELGEIRAIEGTVVTIKNTQNITASTLGLGNSIYLYESNDSFLGKMVVDSGFLFSVYSLANNSLGKGTFEVKEQTAFNFSLENHSESADFVINHTAGATTFAIDTASYGEPRRGSLTLTGDLSGTGDIAIGKRFTTATVWYNTLIHDGDSTLSGDVAIAGGFLRINGTWSGTGDVLAFNQYTGNGFASAGNPAQYGVEGNGTLGLGTGKTLTLQGNTHNTVGTDAQLIPGTDGTVGIFTVGTDDTNSVVFGTRSQLLIDIDGASADQLIINGNLDLGGDSDSLVLNVLNAPSLGFYNLVSYSGSLNGVFDDVIGLPDGYSLDYSTPGQINLVPEPAALSLLGLGALGLLRRRRN